MTEGSTSTTVNGATAQTNAPNIPNWVGTYLGYGICKYTPQVQAFATAATETQIYFPVSKAHRLIRVALSQFVASTGVLDPTGVASQIRRNDYYYGGQQDIQASTPGYPTTVAVATDIFEFNSHGWVYDASVYTIAITGQNADSATVEIYLQYMVESTPTIEQG